MGIRDAVFQHVLKPRPVAYVYFGEGARRAAMSDLWSREEARVIAERIARGFTRAGGNEKAPPG
jgi:hypothetical protein